MFKRLSTVIFLAFIFCVLIRVVQAAAVITGKVGIETNLTETPSHTGKLIEALPEQTLITILQRQSSWTKVDYSGTTGWIPTLTIRSIEIVRHDDTQKLADKLTADDNGTVVATMGIRGLDKETLGQAKYNEKQMALLETYQVSDKDVNTFISAGKLQSKTIAYIDQSGDKQASNTKGAN